MLRTSFGMSDSIIDNVISVPTLFGGKFLPTRPDVSPFSALLFHVLRGIPPAHLFFSATTA
jgi:hypothetical protein